MTHPIDSILFPEGRSLPSVSPCDHYAGSEKLILKSFELQNKLQGVFDITCDLEDGAQVGDEQNLRKKIIEILNSEVNTHKSAGVRVHDFTSNFFEDDVKEVIKKTGKIISHITVPKITSLNQAREILAYVKKISAENKLPQPIPVHLLIETHQAVHEVWDIAALPGLRGLDFGIMDFISAHQGAISDQFMRSPGQFEHPLIIRAKTALTSACLAHSIIPVHNVTTDFSDSELTFDDALRARVHFGFLRMWSIHPNQVQQIIDAFKPDETEVQTACAIIEAAQSSSWGPIRYRDHLHDKASYRYYWTLLKRAQRAGIELSETLKKLF